MSFVFQVYTTQTLNLTSWLLGLLGEVRVAVFANASMALALSGVHA